MGLLLLRLLPFGEEYSIWERWLLQYKEWLSTGILVSLPSVLSPEPATPESLQVSLVNSSLCLPEPRVNGCKQNFLCWPYNSLSASPAISPWQTETLLLFTGGYFLRSFPVVVLQARQPNLGFRPHISQWEPTHPFNISPELQLPPVGAQPALLCLLYTPYQSCFSEVISSVCPWL